MKNNLYKLDLFGAKVPSFNLNGKSHVGTPIGLVGSFLLIFIVLAFASIRFIHLVTYKNPLVTNTSEVDKHQNEGEAIDLDSFQF